MKQRICATILSLCLLAGLLPAAALAAADEVGNEVPIACTQKEDCPAENHEEGCPLYVAPEKPAMSGSCGATANDDVTWELIQNNDDDENPTYTLTISGRGVMADFPNAGTAPWYQLFPNKGAETKITEIVIELLFQEAEKSGIALISSLFLRICQHIDLKPLQTVFTC